jgi:uncharacterized protein YdhG (YjbR/CyaY superfamily)
MPAGRGVDREPLRYASSLTGRGTLVSAQDLGCLDLRGADVENGAVSDKEIDQYLGTLDEPKKATLADLRDTIVAIVPDAEQCVSYGVPAFKLRGKTIAGFAAFKSHLSYLPHSGSVIPQLTKETEGYTKTKGSLHFSVDKPLPKNLVKKLLDARMAEAFGRRR